MEETIRLLENVMCPADSLAIHITPDKILIQRIYYIGDMESSPSIEIWSDDRDGGPVSCTTLMQFILSLGEAKRFITGSRIIIDERICVTNIECFIDSLASAGLIVDMVTHVAGYIIFDKMTLIGTRR